MTVHEEGPDRADAAVDGGGDPPGGQGPMESEGVDALGRDPAEERAEELVDLASMQTDPGEGSADAEPGEATEKQASSGASKGTGSLGLGTLDEGAAGQVTGVRHRDAGEAPAGR